MLFHNSWVASPAKLLKVILSSMIVNSNYHYYLGICLHFYDKSISEDTFSTEGKGTSHINTSERILHLKLFLKVLFW